MESFWSTLQLEVLDARTWETRAELANAIFEWRETSHRRSPSAPDTPRANDDPAARAPISITRLEAICWYNPKRRHSSIGMHSPVEFEATAPPHTSTQDDH
jgi:putative transposase